ncbi:MAG: hypothetical protein EAX96_15230 [Candidatus Lokiarchaeota archaeon]|nr:hypothetical protein [Candidatus Lokiarchaeota archaeon]
MEDSKGTFPFGELIILVLIIFGTYLTSLYSYLLFHTIAELISISIAICVFIIGWNSRRNIDNSFFLILGISFLFTAAIDLIHTLAYTGLNIFIGYGSNLPSSLWIAARFMHAISIIFGLFLFNRKINLYFVLIFYFTTTTLLITLIFSGLFPICYIEGLGLTPFKKISEYIIDVFLFISILILIKFRKEFDRRIFLLIIGSIILTMISELAFTFYIDVYGFSNLIGHLFKIISYFLIYMGIIRIGIQDPIDLLFRKLKKNEVELKNRAQELVHEIEQKNIAEMQLRQFISTVSHELRNPVTVLVQSSEILKKEEERLSSEQKEKLNNLILRNALLLMELLENLLVLSKIDEKKTELNLEKIHVHSLINEIIIQMELRLNEKKMEIKIDCDKGISIFGDKLKVAQIFRILIDNAIKYSDRDSKIEIIVIDHYKGKYNKNSLDGLLIQFIDHGIGIHPKDQERIFDRFFRSSRVYEISGTGLGLTIAKELTEIHKGKIYVESELDKGSKFIVFLPRLNNSH